MPEQLVPIPQPKASPLLGNLSDLRDGGGGALGLMALAEKYGPIYRLALPGGREMVIVSSGELVNELCDETRFDKAVSGPLLNVRNFAGDGLFTADTDDPDWGKAHRILMPAFGPAALREMFDRMVDIADQLLMKWEREGADHRIDVGSDATRLTLDTIALCAFSHRFNSMYSDELNPFVGAMLRSLAEAMVRAQRVPVQTRLMLRERHQYDEDIRYMFQVADGFVADRRSNPLADGQHDILNRIVTAADPETGEKLSDENARYQLVTFLIAGHETTSGLITFTLYHLLKNPDILAKARAQVDKVLGNRTPRFEDLVTLTYLDQILKESLRLWPPAPAFSLRALKDTTLGGKYAAPRDRVFTVLTPQLHRDPAVWGDAETFDPDRFSFERAEKLPPNSWRPFGNGQRSCIGRGFALQEATLFLAILLQRFDLTAADPNYELKIRQALTIKPDGFVMTARRRDTVIQDAPRAQARQAAEPDVATQAKPNGIPITVLYGSNAGTSQAFAERITNDSKLRGYTATIGTLDSAAGKLPTQGMVVVVTSSYEGLPPDDAKSFVNWLGTLHAGALDGVRFAVFGCGNKDWARTYQAVPKEVDAGLAAAGGRQVVERGEANARGDFFGDFDDWYAGFWGPVETEFGQDSKEPAAAPALAVQFVGIVRDPLVRLNHLERATVVANRELVNMAAPGARSKRHLEIALQPGMTYGAGDYLALLPLNPADVVDRALTRFGLAYDSAVVLTIAAGGATSLPTGTPVTAGELLSAYVELSQPATRRQIGLLADATACPPDKKALAGLAADPDTYAREVLDKRVTVLDLLEQHPACTLPFASFLQMPPPLAPRRYSISSSPRWSPEHACLTVAVLNAPARSGHGTYEGVASTYLARLRPGTTVAAAVRPSAVAFHPPESLGTPMIMACAGSGLAPFRGFLQDRALQAKEQGVTPAPALLFFGCDAPDVDYLYRDELEAWAEDDIVELHPAFSAEPVDGIKYVQDRLWADRARVTELGKQGAMFYVCGDGAHMAPAVHETCARIYAEGAGVSSEEAEAWLAAMQKERTRYVPDVFE
jgi:cytochrome P450/NADPH-cytochrome P450 reductase